MRKISVLICDDSALMRKVLRKAIESDFGLTVAGVARDGEDAVIKARELKPDVITMDINMPKMDGVTALQIIVDEKIAPVIMVSSLSKEGAVITFEAMALGAFDFIAKPHGTISREIKEIEKSLIKKIKAAAKKGSLKKLGRKRTERKKETKPVQTRKPRQSSKYRTGRISSKIGFKAIALGISTGGPKTIFDVLPYLPADLNAAIFMVQHMPPTFITPFAKRIDRMCKLRCVEAEAGMVVEPGTIYLAKGGFQMTLFKKQSGKIIIRTPRRPETLFTPSVDIMMDSVLDVFGTDTIGVLMTGMGHDGADAMVNIVNSGGTTIAESEETAVVFGMPNEAIERGGANIIAPSWDIANLIIRLVKNG